MWLLPSTVLLHTCYHCDMARSYRHPLPGLVVVQSSGQCTFRKLDDKLSCREWLVSLVTVRNHVTPISPSRALCPSLPHPPLSLPEGARKADSWPWEGLFLLPLPVPRQECEKAYSCFGLPTSLLRSLYITIWSLDDMWMFCPHFILSTSIGMDL